MAEKLLGVHRSRWVLRYEALKTRGRVRHIVQSRLWSRRRVSGSQWRFLEGWRDALHRECKKVPSQVLMSQLLSDGTLILGGSFGPCVWAKCCQALAQHPVGVRDVSAIFLVT